MRKNRHYLNLIYELSRIDFKLKYYGSVLGMLWSFLKPFLMLAILYVVFFYFLRVDIENYHLYLLLGIVMWNFFADTTKESAQSILSKATLLQKTGLPPFVVIVSTIIHSCWTLFITLGIFFAFSLVLGLSLTWSAFTLVFIVILLVLLTAGTSLFIAPLYMKFRDFSHLWDIFLQMLFWVTPIVYQYTLVPEPYVRWYLLNPLSRLIIDARNVTLYHFVPETPQLLITTALVLAVLGLGAWVFARYSRQFIEEI